ncbi:hypothetical protein PtrSN002B_011769 [Pyrenophora tritici-repentis]|uniref:Uncharacterized protein n=1 Tax=Pyrenophora tritici-repentis TaxID=45151 RepID=A0A2W1CLB8_9PLEO|nr:hypothetical protein PtrV1_09425 [Pyrenophora tritici-repentis]KAF7443124.1 hypothetical protein A1F99_126310 [Pyrenophora tritici-repentis]KAF7568394.1 hypothetical protein PtrM4_130070 [Pyrenophora tritici-repentis]KAG9377196.1 hypothetical protein A1F94_012796 [Pyrenophora tritici-repentis]KAI0569008.1 hypothetical protein Alg130_11828 [Pyrenophora tritici-repentis]
MNPNANHIFGAEVDNRPRSVPNATEHGNNARIGNTNESDAAAGQELTEERLKLNNSNRDHGTTFCQQVLKAINCQRAGLESNIDLPIECYMPQKSQLSEWIKQQAV